MPRAFDRRQLGIDRDPLRSLLPEVSKLPSLDIPDIFAVCNQPFITGMKLLGTGEGEVAKIATGLQAVIDTLFGTLFCNAQTGISPQTMFGALGDLLEPIINSPFVQGLVELADWLGRATGTFLGDVFQGLIALVDWVCGILTCNPNASGTTPQTLIDGFQAVLDPIIANPFIQGIIAWADEVGVAVGNFALDLYNGILAMVEALCSLVTTGALPTTYGNWSNTPLQIVTDLAALAQTLLDNPLIDGLRDLIAGTGNLLYDTISGLSQFITELAGLLGAVITGPQAILDLFGDIFGEDGFVGWLTSLPFIGPLVSKLTGLDSSGDIALDLATLGNWAGSLLTQTSNIPADRLIGSLPEAIFATLPVSSISFTAGNLLSQGAFGNANTVEAGGGWAWDGTTTATGSGGSVKATATGSLQQIYSRQTIKIAAGDRVDVAASVKTAGFTSGSMVLSVIPWVGTTAQTAHVIHTRTTSAATFAPMTGSRLRFGGTAEAGEVLLPANITAITVRLAVTANAGAEVWFDDVSVKKAGALAQTLVEYLEATWQQAWDVVFGSGGVGKKWFDFVTALSTVFTRAGEGVTNAGIANGNALGIIDGIGQAILGDAAYAQLQFTAKQSIRKLVGTLFGVSNPVLEEILAGVIPELDGSIIGSGTVPTEHLDTDGIGSEINPTAGSGAQISRRNTNNQQASPGDVQVVAGYYDHVDFSPGADIEILNSSNVAVTGTGTKANLAGVFRVTQAGWYMVELCIRLNPSWSGGGKVAPLLWRSASFPGQSFSKYKMGTDGVYVPQGFGAVGPRFVQSTYIVYLPAGGAVKAGYNAEGTGLNVLDADSNGTETYFSISLLNKTY